MAVAIRSSPRSVQRTPETRVRISGEISLHASCRCLFLEGRGEIAGEGGPALGDWGCLLVFESITTVSGMSSSELSSSTPGRSVRQSVQLDLAVGFKYVHSAQLHSLCSIKVPSENNISKTLMTCWTQTINFGWAWKNSSQCCHCLNAC